MKCFKVKAGDKWASHEGLTLDPSKARIFAKQGHAKSHIRHESKRWGRYNNLSPEIIEFEVLEDKEGWVSVQLPSDDPVLSDFLEERGYTEASNKLRRNWTEV